MRSVQAKEKGILSNLWLGMARVKLENFPPSCSPPVRFSPLGRSILLSLEIHKLFFPVPFLRNFSGVASRGLETRAQESTCIRGPRNQFCVCSWIQGERFAKLNKKERERERIWSRRKLNERTWLAFAWSKLLSPRWTLFPCNTGSILFNLTWLSAAPAGFKRAECFSSGMPLFRNVCNRESSERHTSGFLEFLPGNSFLSSLDSSLLPPLEIVGNRWRIIVVVLYFSRLTSRITRDRNFHGARIFRLEREIHNER